MRKVPDKQCEVDEVRRRNDLAAVHVDRVADRHERVERDPDRQDDVQRDDVEMPAEEGEDAREAAREEIEVLEAAEHPEVERQTGDERRAAPRRRMIAAEIPADKEVDDRRADQQSEKPPVPRRVEVITRRDEHPVLRAIRQQPVERVDDQEERDEMERIENHQRVAATRPLDSRKSKSAPPTTSWPRGVKWMLRWKNKPARSGWRSR